MTEAEKIRIGNLIIQIVQKAHKDIQVYIEFEGPKEDAIILFFWNKISEVQWNDAHFIRCREKDIRKCITQEIIPYFFPN